MVAALAVLGTSTTLSGAVEAAAADSLRLVARELSEALGAS